MVVSEDRIHFVSEDRIHFREEIVILKPFQKKFGASIPHPFFHVRQDCVQQRAVRARQPT